MKLVETDEDRPEDEIEPPPHPNPPRPEKRRAAASLILTTTILVGTVVMVYTVFPGPPATDPVGAAIRGHRAPEPKWQLVAPELAELRAWSVAVLGESAPFPAADIVGARPIELRDRKAALVRYKVGADEVSVLIERGADVAAARGTRASGDEVADAWRDGPWTIVVVGPASSAAAWRGALDVP